MVRDLFREESLKGLGTALWQPLLLSRPISTLSLIAFSLIVPGIFVVFATSVSFAQKTRTSGYLVPDEGWIQVRAQAPAAVHKILVEEGDRVDAGDVLFEMGPSGAGLQSGIAVTQKLLEDIEKRRSALQSQLTAVNGEIEIERRRGKAKASAFEHQMSLAEQEVNASERRMEIANQELHKGRMLREKGVLSDSHIKELADEVEERRAALAGKEGELLRIRMEYEAVDMEVNALELDWEHKKAGIEERLFALGMERSLIEVEDEARILAPRNGRIASIQVELGAWVDPGETMLDILPLNGEMNARLFVDSSILRSVEVGQEVRVFIDAFNSEDAAAQEGRILSISETSIGDHDEWFAFEDTTRSATSVFRVDVEFPGGFDLIGSQQRALRPGMTVSADLVYDHGTLLDWVIGPIQRTANRL